MLPCVTLVTLYGETVIMDKLAKILSNTLFSYLSSTFLTQIKVCIAGNKIAYKIAKSHVIVIGDRKKLANQVPARQPPKMYGALESDNQRIGFIGIHQQNCTGSITWNFNIDVYTN